MSKNARDSVCVTTDRRQFILFYLFYFSPFFLFLFAYLRFGSHFRSHDSHVTEEHMVELGAIFCCCFFCKSKQFFNVQGHVHCILKVTSLVQVQEAPQVGEVPYTGSPT